MAKEKLIGYCMRSKKKEEILDAQIVKNAKGGYMAKGVTENGDKLCAMLSEANALQAIKDGVAKKAF